MLIERRRFAPVLLFPTACLLAAVLLAPPSVRAGAEPSAAIDPPGTDALGDLVKTFPFRGKAFAVDAARHRVYVASPTSNAVEVIDAQTLGIVASVFVGSSPNGLSIAPDGRRLYVANAGSTVAAVAVVDLETLTTLPAIALSSPVLDVAAGLGGRLYVAQATDTYGSTVVAQVDAVTGAATPFPDPTGMRINSGDTLRLTPDRATLFTARAGYDQPARRWDVSGSAPALTGNMFLPSGGNQQDLVVSPNGRFYVNLYGTGNSGGYRTTLFSVANYGTILGTFDTSAYPTCAAFSPDSSLAYIYFDPQTYEVRPYSTSTYLSSGPSIRARNQPTRMTFDAAGRYLFTAESESFYTGPFYVRVYSAVATPPSRLVNVSTRLRVEVGDNVGIGGFVVAGSASKRVVIRALGPSLSGSGVAGVLADPVLELRNSSGALVAANDNWADTQAADLAATGLAPARSAEAAIVATLAPGAYTAVVRGAGQTSGVALVEVYDVDGLSTPRAVNISTRGRVQTGDDVMIAGFVVANAEKRVLVRVLGPSLSAAGVSGVLADPTVELRDSAGALVAQNDNWGSTQFNAIQATGRAPADVRESALLATLPAGAYTAIVRGAGNSAGVALVEVYDLD